MGVCVKLSRTLGYSIEEILAHNIDWISSVLEELEKQEFEDTLLQMALHGVSQKEINKLRNAFEDNKDSKPKDIRIPLAQFRNMGLAMAKPNFTKVIRKKDKK